MSNPHWDNYELIFQERRGGNLVEIPFFGTDEGLDMNAISAAVKLMAKSGAVRIILNFPNNPAGYAPTHDEVDALVSLINEVADGGADVLVLCDDAYFGLFYEDTVHRESLFARLSSLHERVLAIKIDGPTKEDYVWGFRVGFVTFGSRGLKAEHHDALVKKYMGAIRSSVSCSNTVAQHLLVRSVADERTASERKTFFTMLQNRYKVARRFVDEHPCPPELKALPFNSGYFMSFRCIGIKADDLRRKLLEQHGIGTIAFGDDYLRVAFASLDDALIQGVYQTIYETAGTL
jgi:aspartate/methionine/tyrosine aminotransferase